MKKLSYSEAGVDIERGDALVDRIKGMVGTRGKGVDLSGIGSFGSILLPNWQDYQEPVLVTGVDGVGTKLLLAQHFDSHFPTGIDLVAMSANDILAQGARPLLFFDYLATGKIEEETLLGVIEGIEEGCRQSDCSLAGGETAEMPGFYPEGRYDLAGFCLGLADREKVVTGKEIKPGDRLVGLAASGLHSNGFSLARKLFFGSLQMSGDEKICGSERKLSELLLEPTKIYVRPVLAALDAGFQVKGMAHITGGGIGGNLSRILPEGCIARIELASIPELPIYQFIRSTGLVDTPELFRTFNMGVGFIMAVAEDDVENLLNLLEEEGTDARVLGEVLAEDIAKEKVAETVGEPSGKETISSGMEQYSFQDKKVYFS